MDLKILDKKKNELLKRTEVTADMHEKTIPSKQLIREKLSALLNTAVETIAITQVKSKFGSAKAKVYARVYSSVADLKKTEPKYIIKRNFGEEKKAEANADADAPAAFKK
ncbi:MAG: 30S ribosomal protein S24e [archaeon]|jgi:small subunit ribosomal protein S24e